MAENLDLDDPQFWLPLEFLSDDDLLTDFKKTSSDLSSPVESVLSFTETESDHDEFFTELTRRLTHSTYLSNNVWKPNHPLPYDQTNKSLNLATSPQSTLCNVMGERGNNNNEGSSRGSPNCSSPTVVSPVIGENMVAKNLLYAAAEEVAKLRRIDDHFSTGFDNRASVLTKNCENKSTGYYSNQAFSYQQLQANRFQHQQMWRRENTEGTSLGLSPSAWPTLQQSQSHKQHPVAAGSGMRAVFLGNQVVKRQCSGTGVFLPRSAGTPTQTRKKPGCSAVVHPERIIQALNTKLERIDTHHLNQNRFPHDYDTAIKNRKNVLIAQAQQRREISMSRPTNNEIRLPQEWTY